MCLTHGIILITGLGTNLNEKSMKPLIKKASDPGVQLHIQNSPIAHGPGQGKIPLLYELHLLMWDWHNDFLHSLALH